MNIKRSRSWCLHFDHAWRHSWPVRRSCKVILTTRSHWQPVFTRVCLRLRRGESNHVALCYINTRLVCRARKVQEKTETQLSARVLQLVSPEWKSCATRVMQACWQSQQCLCDVTRKIVWRTFQSASLSFWRQKNDVTVTERATDCVCRIEGCKLKPRDWIKKNTRERRVSNPQVESQIAIPDRNLRWDWV